MDGLGVQHAVLYLLLALSALAGWEGMMIVRFARTAPKRPSLLLIYIVFGLVSAIACGAALLITRGAFGNYFLGLTIVSGAVVSVFIVPMLRRRLDTILSEDRLLAIVTAVSVAGLLAALSYVALANSFGAGIQIRILRYVISG